MGQQGVHYQETSNGGGNGGSNPISIQVQWDSGSVCVLTSSIFSHSQVVHQEHDPLKGKFEVN